ncbi:MAG: hypothetical protein M1832_000682 [Thelocarpon impressellum]|nr:MAG: hypothetical protein M1832_000682 [Thelocarpon impressellum]
MLPPFRIRYLRSSNNPSGPDLGDDFVSSPAGLSDDGVIRLEAPEYDSILADHPEAALSYMDEDDGEVITIGSSFELAQRLEEPAPASPTARAGAAIGAQPLHMFDVNQTGPALDVWRGIELETRRRQPSALQPEPSRKGKERAVESSEQAGAESSKQLPPGDLEVHVDEADDLCRARELQEERDHWSQAAGPRPAAAWHARTDEEPSEMEDFSSNAIVSDVNRQVSGVADVGLHPKGGAEGSEVAEAGDQFRARRRPFFQNSPSSMGSVGDSCQNRWASYDRGATSQQEASSAVGSAALGPSNLDAAQDEVERPEKSLFEAYQDSLSQTRRSEAALAGDAEGAATEKATNAAGNTPSDDTATPQHGGQTTTPGELLTATIGSLLTGVSGLGAELKDVLREAQRELHNPIHSAPNAAENIFYKAIDGFNAGIQELAQAAHEASAATREAAERTREADVQTLEAAITGLGNLATGIGHFGRGVLYGPGGAGASAQDAPEAEASRSEPSAAPAEQETGIDEAAAATAEPAHPAAGARAEAAQPCDDTTEAETRSSLLRHGYSRGHVPYQRPHDLHRRRLSRRSLRAPGEMARDPVSPQETGWNEDSAPMDPAHGRPRSRSPPFRNLSRPTRRRHSPSAAASFPRHGPIYLPHGPSRAWHHHHHAHAAMQGLERPLGVGPEHWLHLPPPPPGPFDLAHPAPPPPFPPGVAGFEYLAPRPAPPPGAPGFSHPGPPPPPPPPPGYRGHHGPAPHLTFPSAPPLQSYGPTPGPHARPHPRVRHRQSWHPDAKPPSILKMAPGESESLQHRKSFANLPESREPLGRSDASLLNAADGHAKVDEPVRQVKASEELFNAFSTEREDGGDKNKPGSNNPWAYARLEHEAGDINRPASPESPPQPPLQESGGLRRANSTSWGGGNAQQGAAVRRSATVASRAHGLSSLMEGPDGPTARDDWHGFRGRAAVSGPLRTYQKQMMELASVGARKAPLAGPAAALDESREAVAGEAPRVPQHRRMGWESFLERYEKTPGRFPDEAEHAVEAPAPPPTQPRTVEASSRPSKATTTKDKKVRSCVEQLRSMGFASVENGGAERLMVYAQAADGDLHLAMEIIEEDRKAHAQRSA